MISRILTLLMGTTPPPPLPEADFSHLLGALMLRTARADVTLRVEELQVIDRLLMEHCDLNAIEAAKMRAECERLEQALPATGALGPMLVETIPPERRFALREALVAVAAADGRTDPRETALIEAVVRMLVPADVDLME